MHFSFAFSFIKNNYKKVLLTYVLPLWIIDVALSVAVRYVSNGYIIPTISPVSTIISSYVLYIASNYNLSYFLISAVYVVLLYGILSEFFFFRLIGMASNLDNKIMTTTRLTIRWIGLAIIMYAVLSVILLVAVFAIRFAYVYTPFLLYLFAIASLLIFLSVYLSFFFADYSLYLERGTIRDAIKYSIRIATGNKLRIFGYILLFQLIVFSLILPFITDSVLSVVYGSSIASNVSIDKQSQSMESPVRLVVSDVPISEFKLIGQANSYYSRYVYFVDVKKPVEGVLKIHTSKDIKFFIEIYEGPDKRPQSVLTRKEFTSVNDDNGYHYTTRFFASGSSYLVFVIRNVKEEENERINYRILLHINNISHIYFAIEKHIFSLLFYIVNAFVILVFLSFYLHLKEKYAINGGGL